MQANWSLVLNVFLLIAVMAAIARLIRTKRQYLGKVSSQAALKPVELPQFDDIIAVRQVESDLPDLNSGVYNNIPNMTLNNSVVKSPFIGVSTGKKIAVKDSSEPECLMVFLLTKDRRQLVGYELLQTILAAGLRFGDGNLFHRHLHLNGQGPILCSLAAATSSGEFDLQNMGTQQMYGLCMFMQTSGNQTIDKERFVILLETAKQLSESLDTYLLDSQKELLSEASIERYNRCIETEANKSSPN